MKTVAAAAVGFLPSGEVGISLLRQLQVRRRRGSVGGSVSRRPYAPLALVLAWRDGRYGDFGRVVHGIPGFGRQVFGMRIEEARPQEKRLILRVVFRNEGLAALGDPGVVVKLFGDEPFASLLGNVSGRLQVIIAPVDQTLFFHPKRIMLSDMRFVGVVTGQLDMVEAIKRTFEVLPEVQILQDRIRFQRGILFGGLQRLEMCLANQRRAIASGLKMIAQRRFAFGQFGAQRIGAVL